MLGIVEGVFHVLLRSFFNSVNLKTLRGEKKFLNNVQGSLKLSNLFLSTRDLPQSSPNISN